ncbi:ROK family protein [Allorhizobium undicola]|uniref:ROK family protein n=1 Tax=Allorhizobium undicola TaxID=78527 RepID=UPI001FDA9649|nr:ROK family protein [Allorhizobium undicola]
MSDASSSPAPGAAAGEGAAMEAASRCTVVGIDLGGTKLAGGLARLDGTLLAREEVLTLPASQQSALSQIADMVLRLAGAAGVERRSIAALVVGVPAVVSPQTGLASLSPNLALPADRPLSRLLEEALGLAVAVENDVNLAAFAEARAGQGQASLAFVSFGTGVGMGLVVDGQLMRGANGRAGEIGFLPIGATPHAVAGQSVNGLLEDEIGTAALRRRHASRWPDMRDLFSALRAGDDAALAALDDLACTASIGIAAIQTLIDPALTVIGGGIGSQPEFLAALRRHVAALLPFECRLAESRFGAEAGMIGAVMMACELARQGRVS